MQQQQCLLVAVDIGSAQHQVVIARSGMRRRESFKIDHSGAGFKQLFERIEKRRRDQEPVWVIFEGKGGWARPLDELVVDAGYHLVSITNLQMARFRQTFAELAKTDSLDASNALRALDLWLHNSQASKLCVEVKEMPTVNRHLRELTRHRSSLLKEQTRLANQLTGQLQAYLPGLIQITGSVLNLWFLNLLYSRTDVSCIARMRAASLLRIPGIGKQRLQLIRQWQQDAVVGRDLQAVAHWIRQDIRRLLELRQQLKQLEAEIEELNQNSDISLLMSSIPGFGSASCSQLAGEIGSMDRFETEASLAVYLGCAPVSHQSGNNKKGTKRHRFTNRRAANALCQAVARHRTQVAESNAYYLKKRAHYGGRHPKAVRALARKMVPIIWSMAKQNRPYEIREVA